MQRNSERADRVSWIEIRMQNRIHLTKEKSAVDSITCKQTILPKSCKIAINSHLSSFRGCECECIFTHSLPVIAVQNISILSSSYSQTSHSSA